MLHHGIHVFFFSVKLGKLVSPTLDKNKNRKVNPQSMKPRISETNKTICPDSERNVLGIVKEISSKFS